MPNNGFTHLPTTINKRYTTCLSRKVLNSASLLPLIRTSSLRFPSHPILSYYGALLGYTSCRCSHLFPSRISCVPCTKLTLPEALHYRLCRIYLERAEARPSISYSNVHEIKAEHALDLVKMPPYQAPKLHQLCPTPTIIHAPPIKLSSH